MMLIESEPTPQCSSTPPAQLLNDHVPIMPRGVKKIPVVYSACSVYIRRPKRGAGIRVPNLPATIRAGKADDG